MYKICVVALFCFPQLLFDNVYIFTSTTAAATDVCFIVAAAITKEGQVAKEKSQQMIFRPKKKKKVNELH